MGTLEPWKLCLPLILSPNNLRALFCIILSSVPLLLSFHFGSLHLFVFHCHLFVLSPIIPSPCFPSSCFPSFCGPLCNSHHHIVLGHVVSLYLVPQHPFVFFPIIPSSCLSEVSLIILFHHFVSRHTLSHHPCIPNSKKLLG